MDFFTLSQNRESCRNFDDSREVEREKLEKIIACVRLAPSACNAQPWFFTVVASPEKRKEVASAVQKMNMNLFTSKARAFIAISQDKAAGVAGKVASRFFAPYDIGIAAAHICLAAQELGLGSCILGWFDEKKVIAACQLDDNKKVSLVIALGYAANQQRRDKKRKKLESIAKYM